MRTKLKEFADIFTDNSELIIYSAYALIAVIMLISILIAIMAWRDLNIYTYEDQSCEDMDRWEEEAILAGVAYESEYDEPSKFDQMVEVFAPKLIWGLAVSTLILIIVAALFYFVSKYI